MPQKPQLIVFGEVLFDCFPDGKQVLGGAPFNVAWHAQALGNRPRFISRIGEDIPGGKIISAMNDWSMDNTNVQRDPLHQTGRVEVKFIDDEPQYDITPDCAYDFISADGIQGFPESGILYHGTLALRNRVSRNTLMHLSKTPCIKIFLDVNLRSPWWKKEDVYSCLENACWVKLNQDELKSLGFTSPDIEEAMSALLSQFGLHQLILTRGEKGAIVHTDSGAFHKIVPDKIERFVDTVGAGDAFTAIYIHGLISKWTIPDILTIAQRFSGKIIGLRGATSDDPGFYRDFVDFPE